MASPPDAIAAIDIGTNSVHMVVARPSAGGRFEVLTKEKESVRLGSGPSDMKRLAGDAIDRGVAALDRCRRIAQRWEAPIVAVATSAVREADNRGEFIRRARDEAGVEVEVISGHEEARLIHLGVLQALDVYDRTILLCDIGGGSTEIVHGRGEELLSARSLKLGAIRLTERFFPDRQFRKSAVAACRGHVRDVLAPLVRDTRAIRPEVGIGSSGTIEAVLTMSRADGSAPRRLNSERLTSDELAGVVRDVIAAGTPERVKELPGADPSRADILLAGALILEGVMERFRLDEILFSEYALREGVLLDALRRTGAGGGHLADIRRQSVLHLMELCEEDPDHAFQVAFLADRLFEQLAAELELPERSREWLEAAALLANVGLFVSHAKHHQHTYYVIRNTDHLMGFTDHEIELIAQVARYHRRSAPSDRHPPFAALDADDQRIVRGLAALLRIAIGLDRSHAELVQHVEVEVTDGCIRIAVSGEPGTDVGLEVFAANQRSGLLADVTGRAVAVAGE